MATPKLYTLSLHDALPILGGGPADSGVTYRRCHGPPAQDRRSTRLNFSHRSISYAAFRFKKKINNFHTSIYDRIDYLIFNDYSGVFTDNLMLVFSTGYLKQ